MSSDMPEQSVTGGVDPLHLAQHLCFSVQNASRAFGALYRVVLRDTGLTYPQYLVMISLWEHGELTVKALGELLRLDSGTLSPLLKRLEAAGLVSRERSTVDERSVIVRLTPEGSELRRRAREVPRRIFEATGLDAAEGRELQSTLRRLTAALDSAPR